MVFSTRNRNRFNGTIAAVIFPTRASHDLPLNILFFASQCANGKVKINSFCLFHMAIGWLIKIKLTFCTIISYQIAAVSGSFENVPLKRGFTKPPEFIFEWNCEPETYIGREDAIISSSSRIERGVAGN